MLRPSFWQIDPQILSVSKLIQDLSVLASEVEIGGLLQVGSPNYALLYRASRTIRSLLQVTLSPNGPLAKQHRTEEQDIHITEQDPQANMMFAPFDIMPNTNLWGFEQDFWQDLGAHSSLLTTCMDPT